MVEIGVTKVVEKCIDGMEKLLRKRVESVVGLTKEEKGWRAVIEALERKAIPDSMDLIGRYEVKLSEDGTLLGYSQILIRRRQDRLGIEFKEEKNG